MGSADMYGQIDVARDRWKDAAGYIEPVPRDANGRLMCPMCRADARQQELHQVSGRQVWECLRHHSFQGTVLPE
jgi:hypothetical protein